MKRLHLIVLAIIAIVFILYGISSFDQSVQNDTKQELKCSFQGDDTQLNAFMNAVFKSVNIC